MAVVARFEGIKIQFYNDEHPPPHFHAEYGEHVAMISIETLEVLKGYLPRPQYRKVVAWAAPRKSALHLAWVTSLSDLNPGKIP
jgi:Domain of unknown function (DUF4160)